MIGQGRGSAGMIGRGRGKGDKTGQGTSVWTGQGQGWWWDRCRAGLIGQCKARGDEVKLDHPLPLKVRSPLWGAGTGTSSAAPLSRFCWLNSADSSTSYGQRKGVLVFMTTPTEITLSSLTLTNPTK